MIKNTCQEDACVGGGVSIAWKPAEGTKGALANGSEDIGKY